MLIFHFFINWPKVQGLGLFYWKAWSLILLTRYDLFHICNSLNLEFWWVKANFIYLIIHRRNLRFHFEFELSLIFMQYIQSVCIHWFLQGSRWCVECWQFRNFCIQFIFMQFDLITLYCVSLCTTYSLVYFFVAHHAFDWEIMLLSNITVS